MQGEQYRYLIMIVVVFRLGKVSMTLQDLAALSLLFKIIFIISFPLWIIEWIFSFSPINSSRYEAVFSSVVN